MNIDDRYIADARERLRKKAQNEATCFALNDMLKDAQDEVRRLREENERQRFDILAMNQSLDLLREENERLRKDAERYQHIRSLVRTQAGAIKAQSYIWHCGNSRRKLDAAIDAARGAK